jgi:ferredoxin-nitrate reductase
MKNSIKTLCPYCGVGCGLEVGTQKEQGKVIGDRNHSSNQGMVCVKGATILESLDKNRLEYPMFRRSLTDSFQRISWEEAFYLMVERIKIVKDTQGVDAICMYGSGQLQTEDYYVAQKLLKGCLGTNNFDSNSRLCMSSAVASYVQSFGSDGPPCCYEDLDLSDCAFIIGSNTAECHPIVFNRLHKQIKKSPTAKMIVVDPRRTKTAEVADLHLAIKPGTDINLLNGIAYLLWRWHGLDKDFIENHTDGFGDYLEVIKHYPPEIVAEQCGISQEDLERTAGYWLESAKVLSLWSQGINQSSEGTAKARTLINLHLMTGQIGKPGCGPFSLTGQPNAMGGREAGGLAYILPGHRLVTDAQHRREVEEFWGLTLGSISPHPGKDAWRIITDLERGEVGLFWIAATNPAVSMPNLERTKAALLQSPFTVYQDAYYPTETASYAHLLLPAAQWGEKTGIMTNSERVVTLCSAFRNPPGEAKADWQIFAEVGRHLGFAKYFNFSDSADVYAEFVQLTRNRPCDMAGLSHELLGEKGAIQWPFPANSPEFSHNKRLYTDFCFHTPNGKAQFASFHAKGLAELPDEKYPFVLTIGRLYGHWHTQTRTGLIDKITKMHPHPFIEINPQDASTLGIKDGDMVEVRSRRGQAQFPARITSGITHGTVFVPMHWGALWANNAEANSLTHPTACPYSIQPELKACAVKIRVSEQLPTSQNCPMR